MAGPVPGLIPCTMPGPALMPGPTPGVLPLPKLKGVGAVPRVVDTPTSALSPSSFGEEATLFPHRSKMLMLPSLPLLTLPPAMPSSPMVTDWEGRPGSVSLYFPAGSLSKWKAPVLSVLALTLILPGSPSSPTGIPTMGVPGLAMPGSGASPALAMPACEEGEGRPGAGRSLGRSGTTPTGPEGEGRPGTARSPGRSGTTATFEASTRRMSTGS